MTTQTWIQTFTGGRFDLLDPTPEMVNVKDIVHSLSMSSRFNGHLKEFYSIAEHSAHVATLTNMAILSAPLNEDGRLESMYALKQSCARANLYALLHDAAEAYIGDIVSPLKHIPALAAVIRPIESNIEQVIFQAFGLDAVMPAKIKAIVHRADMTMLHFERRGLFGSQRAEKWDGEDEYLSEFPATFPFWGPSKHITAPWQVSVQFGARVLSAMVSLKGAFHAS